MARRLHAQFELLAPLLAREGVDVWTATVADLDAGMERAKQRHAAAVARVRAVLNAHSSFWLDTYRQNYTSTPGGCGRRAFVVFVVDRHHR
ncbi:hypothetical protein NCCP2495_27920 [Dietzia sp. NCCP-2495]|uniref:hypothetical protein n=1 Tax=Dietzia sp. NCCP-2495 TaxID=2934675 RepID=UPI00222F2F07|nr:hypothetical protein [Dietzia sp. NCCP-2495]GLB64912.1 hypothetical protein NCCP2495_27920 [Dietzia sp. NCCP-2495]